MMKKWFTFILTAALAVASLAACSPTTQQPQTAVQESGEAPMPDQIPMTTGGASDKVPDPNVDPVAIISVYHGSNVEDIIVQSMDSLSTDQMDAQELVDKLVEYGVLTEGTEVLSFTVEGEDENAAGTLDLNQAVSGEGCSDEMFLAEIGNTFIENYQLATLKLLVNGANYSGNEIQQGDGDVLEYRNDYSSIGGDTETSQAAE